MPSEHCLESTDEALNIVRNHKPAGLLASLDVFTNVPVQEAMDLIQSSVYYHPTLPPLKTMRAVLGSYPAPARRSHPSAAKRQTVLANRQRRQGLIPRLSICQHVHVPPWKQSPGRSEACHLLQVCWHLRWIKWLGSSANAKKKKLSGTRFTTEFSVENWTTFLDIDISQEDGALTTKVNRKCTNKGRCMTGKSEFPTR